jgi:APA family basic amino acid/polyamine antiporter
MTVLARALRVLDYFTLAFGTMVGAGWLVVMDDWLRRGGPAGAMLGFAVGGVALLPVGWVYGKLAGAIPDAASEVAYTERVFPQSVSLLTGWMMVLAYGIVCPWEAAAIGKIAAYLLPPLNRWPLGLLGGQPLPRVLTGLVLTAAITTVNYRGIRWSSRLQNWATLLLWLLFAAFGAAGLLQGQAANLQPLFAHAPGVAVLLVLQVVPYFMTGFEAVPKCAEESVPDFPVEGFLQAMVLAIGVATVFYVGVIGVVAWVAPWRELMDRGFLTAAAFEHTIGRGWWVRMIFAAALASLIKVFNGNFLAASRMLYALGRRGWLPTRLGTVHERYRTPGVAVVALGIATAAVSLGGERLLVPIAEVGSLAAGLGWLASCLTCVRLRPARGARLLGGLGALVAGALVLMKLLPVVPGHLTAAEYGALAAWLLLGLVLRQVRE